MVTLEVCVESPAGARSAAAAGAERVELCCALALGGLTPSAAALAEASALGSVAVVALLRPRAGDFLYSEEELRVLAEDLLRARDAGASGVALGCLTADGDVDQPRCERLVALAGPLPVTFHRAFDQVREPERALESLVELGFARVLTSGQAENAHAGRELLGHLVRAARGRLEVVAAGGVRSDNVREIVAASGVPAVHFSASVARASAMRHRNLRPRLASAGGSTDESVSWETDGGRVRAMLERLRAP